VVEIDGTASSTTAAGWWVLDWPGQEEVQRTCLRVSSGRWLLREDTVYGTTTFSATLQGSVLVVEDEGSDSGEQWTLQRLLGGAIEPPEVPPRQGSSQSLGSSSVGDSPRSEAAADWGTVMAKMRSDAAEQVKERSDRRRGSGDLGGRQSGEDSNDLELDALQPCIRKASNCSNYSTLSRRDSISMVGDLINDFQLTMKKLMAEKGESSLTSWFRHFDTNGNGKIDYEEFYSGLQRLNYVGDIKRLWREVDIDGSGEITFDEIDADSAQVWNMFRRWCGSKFSGPKDMVQKLQQAYDQQCPGSEIVRGALTKDQWSGGLPLLGWAHGYEPVFYEAMMKSGDEQLVVRNLRWLQGEVDQHHARMEAKRHAQRQLEKQVAKRQAGQYALKEFKSFLKRQFGNLFRAWRKVLDKDESMTVQKHELFKACRQLDYHGDVRSLWHALDFDDSGVATLDEFDPYTARLLALFLAWQEKIWGKRNSFAMFKEMDTSRNNKISFDKFCRECELRGFGRAAELAPVLDVEDRKYLKHKDFTWGDVWRPPAWITANPNWEDADRFKDAVRRRYGHMLKAWRKLLDRDGSTTCSWQEFQVAAKRIKFGGDVAGAWLALDEDLSGFITLNELDIEAHESLTTFRRWCHEEFGSVRYAFLAMDSQGKGQLTRRQFIVACSRCGYRGHVDRLFKALDMQRALVLTLADLRFMDDWPLLLEDQEVGTGEHAGGWELKQQRKAVRVPVGVEFGTDGPGPGAYEPKYPMLRQGRGVAFSTVTRGSHFAGRADETVGPDRYNPSLKATTDRKPAWSLSSGAERGGGAPFLKGPPTRRPQSARPAASTCEGRIQGARGALIGRGISRDTAQEFPVPGPGAYDIKLTSKAPPAFKFQGRGGIRLHPSRGIAEVIDICSVRVQRPRH